ncbi:MAG: hypothetical protein WC788_05620 [Candidatus Paceibacterota bacterium]|jgi:type IV secretory pathway component VirB8
MSNEEQILEMLKHNQAVMEQVYISVEKTRKYFLYSLIITILMFVLPLLGLIIVIPMFLNSYVGALNGI